MTNVINRRSFLKSIATVCGAAVVCPVELLKGEPEWIKWARYWDAHDGKKTLDAMRGVTNEQLCELIRATLKDLPPMMFEDAFANQTYVLCKNDNGEYYPGLGLSV